MVRKNGFNYTYNSFINNLIVLGFFLFELIVELVRARDLRFSMGVGIR